MSASSSRLASATVSARSATKSCALSKLSNSCCIPDSSAKSESAPNAIHFTAPKEFGGLEGRWTPEELLLAALSGCFTTTLRATAGNVGFDFTDLQVEASGTVRKAASGYSFSEIVLRPTMKIAEFSERERALDLLTKTERLCLVARSLDIPLRFEPQEVTVAEVSV